jgi:hypothetical protein
MSRLTAVFDVQQWHRTITADCPVLQVRSTPMSSSATDSTHNTRMELWV